MEILQQGAEAVIRKEEDVVIKERIVKNYRLAEIDSKIRKKTTRAEVKLLEKASKLIPVPKILNADEKNTTIKMQYIAGNLLRDYIDDIESEKRARIMKQVGKQIAKLHNQNIIHGDLTTSNMILKDESIYFIDFGLGFISTRIEDKAVDLHLLKQALKSKHYKHFENTFGAALEGYKEESNDFEKLLERFEKVEKRGRYKRAKGLM